MLDGRGEWRICLRDAEGMSVHSPVPLVLVIVRCPTGVVVIRVLVRHCRRRFFFRALVIVLVSCLRRALVILVERLTAQPLPHAHTAAAARLQHADADSHRCRLRLASVQCGQQHSHMRSSYRHQWLDTALTSPTIDHLLRTTAIGDALHSDAATFTSHYHARPQQAVGLQSKLSSAATNSSYNARLSVVKAAGDLRGQARMVSAKTPCASRWKIVRPTESAYVLADEFYRYSARRDLALPPVRHTVLPRQCSSCHGPMAADGLHAQRCIRNSAITILRHNTIEKLLHDVVRDGVGDARRQQPNLPSAERTVPDLLLELDGKILLCDVTVVDPLATSHIKDAAEKPGRVAEKAAAGKVRKYQACADAMHAQHLPFAVEATDGLGESALQLITAIHNSAEQHCTWRDAKSIGTHLADSVAIAVQRCCGMALRASLARENEAAVGRAE